MKLVAINKISSRLKNKRFKKPNAAYSNRWPQLDENDTLKVMTISNRYSNLFIQFKLEKHE